MMSQADKLLARLRLAPNTITTVSIVVGSDGTLIAFALEKSVKLEGIAKSDFSASNTRAVDVLPQLIPDGGGLIRFDK